MEIIDANTAILSNFEVLGLLNSSRVKGDQTRNQSGSLATITYEAIKYLEGTPAAVQSEGCFKKFLEDVKKFGLTKKEKTMILNLRPKTDVEISLIVQSTDQERLTEEQIEELIELIQNTLPE
ncbi:DNA-directed RNA polymerase III subunit RPC9-like [Daphnia pulex]|uniref:DNA-directed RNA polymerase III subunit RPC9-like n=1 Tax=Daphnia pulex TaxID=6669 RepID=UPI001EE12570|nr:DNA-directed RNA polymerase III subunit RPC9-like [Daphnia pulex]XP_046637449.1 DNA-directed RNA polymerase III subunit RPC9-like [Daphnia pulicaria]